MKEVEPEMLFGNISLWIILDHRLKIESYLKLIMKSNCWLLQVEKNEITRLAEWR
jgi:hypothetical protein